MQKSQVKRVMNHFINMALGGELAIEYGALPSGFIKGCFTGAMMRLFELWLDDRGTTSNSEVIDGVQQISKLLSENLPTHFVRKGDENTKNIHSKYHGSNEGDFIYINPQVFKLKYCAGYDVRSIRKYLESKQLIFRGTDGKFSIYRKTPQKGRYYKISSEILSYENGEVKSEKE